MDLLQGWVISSIVAVLWVVFILRLAKRINL